MAELVGFQTSGLYPTNSATLSTWKYRHSFPRVAKFTPDISRLATRWTVASASPVSSATSRKVIFRSSRCPFRRRSDSKFETNTAQCIGFYPRIILPHKE